MLMERTILCYADEVLVNAEDKEQMELAFREMDKMQTFILHLNIDKS
jgi:hypothetical protein